MLLGLCFLVSGSQATIEPTSPIRDVLVWSGSLITHLFILSTRGQCRAANNLAPEKNKVKGAFERPLAAEHWSIGWKTRLSLKPEETFHVKLFTLFHQNRPTF